MMNRTRAWHRNPLIVKVLYPQECSLEQDWGMSQPGLLCWLGCAQVKDEALPHQSWLCDGVWGLPRIVQLQLSWPEPVLFPMEMGSCWRGSCSPNPDSEETGFGCLVVIQITVGKDCIHLSREFSLLSHIPLGREEMV